MIKRFYSTEFIKKALKPNSVLIVYGARQVGKTTLVNEFLKSEFIGKKVFSGFGEDSFLRGTLESLDAQKIISFFSGYDLIFIDEAQKISDIGEALKIMVDHIEGIKIIVTGFSSFGLARMIGEPLVGRSDILTLYPISAMEIDGQFGKMNLRQSLENYLIFGTYPDAINAKTFEDKRYYLNKLINGYLYKDILELEQIKNSGKISDLLRLLALQIGKEVSMQELGNNLEMSKNTVEKYLDLLEKSFVIVKVRGFSRNLRKEVTKTSRYYFYDNGVRNALIRNFNFLNSRDDVGALWENYLFIERMKKREYRKIYANQYFWRTYDQKEIDLVEERDGKLFGYEFKWNTKKQKVPKGWLESYKNTSYEVITPDNYLDFII